MPNTSFTPEQIAQILEAFFEAVGTRQYIGARYVPIFGRKGEESIEWDNTDTYEPLTIVLYQGNSYTSRQFVPVGVDITNQEFWAITGNYNAQVEQYRQTVLLFDGRITANETAIDTLEDTTIPNLSGRVTANETAINTINNTTIPAIEAEIDGLDVPAINQAIEDLQDDIADRPILNKILLCGDSFSSHSSNEQYTATWPTTVANKLGLALTNLASGGAAFYHNTVLYEQMTVQAPALSNKDEYKYIIVYGGVNDARADTTVSNVQANIVSGLNVLGENFPNAKIFLVGPNAGLETFIASPADVFNDYANAMQNAARISTANVVYIDARKWLMCIDSSYSADQLHPSNSAGNNILASSFMQVLGGSDNVYTYEATNTRSTSSVADLLPTKLMCSNGLLKIPASSHVKEAGTALNQNVTLGTIAHLPSNSSAANVRWAAFAFAISSTNVVTPAVIRIGVNGAVALIFDSVLATDTEYTIYVPAQTIGFNF